MRGTFRERLRAAFAPPAYLAHPLAGIDLSESGVKAARLSRGAYGLILVGCAEVRLPAGAIRSGDIVDPYAVADAIVQAAEQAGVTKANVAVPASQSYLFEAVVSGTRKSDWREAVKERLHELTPLARAEAVFDIVPVEERSGGEVRVAGVASARRSVEQILDACDDAGLDARALESETFAMARALVPCGDDAPVLIIDLGKVTTKVAVVVGGIPRFAATFGTGGHALTLAIQKHFGVTEAQARRVKAEQGLLPASGNDAYLAAVRPVLAEVRGEVARHAAYWQERAALRGYEPLARAVLAGGNASVRGLGDYLAEALKIPVVSGDVFASFTPREAWVPPIEHTDSLIYATAIGLALRDLD